MNTERLSPEKLSDDALLAEVTRLAASERTATVRLIAALAEIDVRRLYLGQGCSSLFVYCTSVLRLSEHAADGRIEGARAARRWPSVLGMLEAGELTLTSLSLLAPHLSDDNHRDVLSRARYRSKREVEEIVAALRPRPDAPPLIRQLPQARPAAPGVAPANRIASSARFAHGRRPGRDQAPGTFRRLCVERCGGATKAGARSPAAAADVRNAGSSSSTTCNREFSLVPSPFSLDARSALLTPPAA